MELTTSYQYKAHNEASYNSLAAYASTIPATVTLHPGLLPIDLTKIAAGAICFWQLWSILENESSCNGAKWAKVMQKILVDKTERHFDIDLSELDSKEEIE